VIAETVFALAALAGAEPSSHRVAARVAEQHSDRSFKSLFAEYWVGSMSDAASTEFFLAMGGQEANPLMRDRSVRLTVKGALEPTFLAALTYIAQKTGHHTTARAMIIGTRVVRVVVFVVNVVYGLRSDRRDFDGQR
jgi:hypothetical protein